MASAEIIRVISRLKIASEPQRDGAVAICIIDADGVELGKQTVAPSLARSEYGRLDRIRARLPQSLDVLEREMKRCADSRPARPHDFSFDGCEAGSNVIDLDKLGGSLGCAALVILVVFFVFPTVALVLLGLTVLFGLFAAAAAIGVAFSALTDRWRRYTRVGPDTEVRFVGAPTECGIGYLRPSVSSFRSKFVCFARVKDLVIIAAAEPSPSSAAWHVAQEALRQRRDISNAERLAAANFEAATDVALRLAREEARDADQ